MPPLPLRRAFVARWYITLVGLLLTVALGVAAMVLVPVKYQAKSVVLLLPPSTTTAANPYTNLSSLAGLSDVLDQSLTAESATAQVKAQGNVGTYTVTNDLSSSGPLIVVTSQSDTPAHATALAKYVTNLIPATLHELQTSAGIKAEKDFITSLVINPVDKVSTVTKTRTRALLVAVAGGLLLTVLMVAAVERIGVRRRNRAVARPQPPVRRSPQPHVSKPTQNGAPVAPTAPVAPSPKPEMRRESSARSVKHSRSRRSRAEADNDHEPVGTGR